MSETLHGRVVILRSNPVAPDPRVEKLAAALIGGGWRVMVLAWDRSGQMPKHEEETPIGSIYRMRLRARFGSGMNNLPFLLIWQLFLVYSLLSRHRRYDVIHACDFDTVVPALFVGRLLKKKVVFDIFDLYADSVRNTPKLIIETIAKAEISSINAVDAVILADDIRTRQIAGSRPREVIVVYNSPAVDQTSEFSEPEDDSFRLVYVGLLVKERSLGEVISIVGRHPLWQFDLAGFGGDEQAILFEAKKHANINLHGRVDYRTALRLTNAADVVFAIYDPAVPNHRYSSPNKVFEAMSMGKPLVVARDTNMDRIVDAHSCGIVVNYGHVDEIEQAFETLAGDPGLRRQLGENGKKGFQESYSWELMRERILDLYRRL